MQPQLSAGDASRGEVGARERPIELEKVSSVTIGFTNDRGRAPAARLAQSARNCASSHTLSGRLLPVQPAQEDHRWRASQETNRPAGRQSGPLLLLLPDSCQRGDHSLGAEGAAVGAIEIQSPGRRAPCGPAARARLLIFATRPPIGRPGRHPNRPLCGSRGRPMALAGPKVTTNEGPAIELMNINVGAALG